MALDDFGLIVTQRRISDSSIALQVGLQQAIEQGQLCTHKLRTAMGSLQQQLQQRSCEVEKWRAKCSKMEEEVERLKGRCRMLEDDPQDLAWEQLFEAEPMKLEEKNPKMASCRCDYEKLEEENTDLRDKLENCDRDLHSWKEDCIFFAMKFLSWGPALLKWGPALHHELKQKDFQKRKNITLLARNRKANVVRSRGSSSSIYEGRSGAAVDSYRDLSKYGKHGNVGCPCTNKLWSSRKRKCVSGCNSTVTCGSESSMD